MTMSYRILGGTGIEVSALSLGTMMLGSAGNPDHDDCIKIIHAALAAGIAQWTSLTAVVDSVLDSSTQTTSPKGA